MCEMWKPVPGFEGHYEVSNQGQVRSLSRVNAYGYRLKGRQMSLSYSGTGYLYVTLALAGERSVVHVAPLVMRVFVGPPPPGKEVCHNDGNRKNNVLTNLRYGTRKENMADRKLHGDQPFGEELPWTKLTARQVKKIRELYQPPIGRRDWGPGHRTTRKWTLVTLARRYQVSKSTISLIVQNKIWTTNKE
jgi:hypothetical protein